jgi:hypothetical protein
LKQPVDFVKIMQTGHVTRTSRRRDAHRTLMGILRKVSQLEYLFVDGEKILKWMFKNRTRVCGPD